MNMNKTDNPVPWRKCENLDMYAVARHVPVMLNGKEVIADRVPARSPVRWSINCHEACALLS